METENNQQVEENLSDDIKSLENYLLMIGTFKKDK